jgi:hypothetical protein
MMTFEDRARALEAFGFSPRQSRFLVLAALHSGYCLRRQYVAFAGIEYGKNVRDFLDSLVDRKFAGRFSIRADRGHIYHLQSRTLYRALGQEDNRNRRQASAAVIARKLMLLDFVLAKSGVEWLATEEDKVQLFVDRLGLPINDLPQHVYDSARPATASTIRFFPHKLPIGVTANQLDVRFVVPAHEPAGGGFEAFLRDHARVFARLSKWSVVVIGPSDPPAFERCEAAFERFQRNPVPRLIPHAHELRSYFRTREAIDRGQVADLRVAEINRFRRLRDRFHGAEVEATYQDWLSRREETLRLAASVTSGEQRRAGRLEIVALPFTYTQFGSLPGVA